MGKITRLVIIFRESTPEIVPFREGAEIEAETLFDRARQNWSDVYLCEALAGPREN